MEEMFEKIATVITDVIGAETTNTTQLKRIGQQLFAPRPSPTAVELDS